MMSEQTEQTTEEGITNDVSTVEANQQTATDAETTTGTAEKATPESVAESTPVASASSENEPQPDAQSAAAESSDAESSVAASIGAETPVAESAESEAQDPVPAVTEMPDEAPDDEGAEAAIPADTGVDTDTAAALDERAASSAEPQAAVPDAQAETAASADDAADESTTDTAEASEAADAADAGVDTQVEVDEEGNKRVVRILSVGQEVEGEVKRITDFGAFVDIGVGRDGLLHISELSVQRVGKVSDVLEEGQTITVWIKDLDRKRNRISLTLISPDTKTIRDLEKGEIVEGTVTRIQPYGAFIDIGVGRDALLHVREMSEGYVKRPEDVVSVGETLEARIISLSRRRNRIDLSLKGLRPEPEAEFVPQEQAQSDDAGDEESSFEEPEVLSPMELAFKKAMEAADDEDEKPSKSNRRSGKGRRSQSQSLQDEIIARTLNNRPSEN